MNLPACVFHVVFFSLLNFIHCLTNVVHWSWNRSTLGKCFQRRKLKYLHWQLRLLDCCVFPCFLPSRLCLALSLTPLVWSVPFDSLPWSFSSSLELFCKSDSFHSCLWFFLNWDCLKNISNRDFLRDGGSTCSVGFLFPSCSSDSLISVVLVLPIWFSVLYVLVFAFPIFPILILAVGLLVSSSD